MSSFSYRPRAIEQTLSLRANNQVVILEGRRAVGKSSLARHLQHEGVYASYETLTDPSTRRQAEADPAGWLEGLSLPAVIDEAQVVPEVSIAAKDLVDQLPEGHHLLLTGSASVGRGTMAGSDPLAGRSSRLRLHPFSSVELTTPAGQPVPSFVDLCFDGVLHPGDVEPTPRTTIIQALRTGGVPSYALPSLPLDTRALYARITSDHLAILGDQVLPSDGRVDAGLALRVLDDVLRTPGGILNYTRVAQDLAIDTGTARRYVDVLRRRFLVHELPNLRAGASRTTKHPPKIHPVDTSSSCESLDRAGHNVGAETELLGQVLESWVVNQIVAAQDWASLRTEAFYWRDAKSQREVDLVLRDDRDRRVGFEVKLASSVSPSDLRGLRAAREHGGLERGFVVYTGSTLKQLGDNIWALPMSALIRATTLETIMTPPSAPASPKTTPASQELPSPAAPHREAPVSPAPLERPRVFLSYVHDDDEYLDGLLTAFARQVESACRFLGSPIELFIDHDALGWGERWQERLDREVASTAFLLAMVTPQYVRSAACQREFTTFRTTTSAAGYDGLLTLLVLDPVWDEPDLAGNAVVTQMREEIAAHQWLEADTPLYELVPGSPAFRATAEKVARALASRVRALSDEAPRTDEVSSPETQEDDSPAQTDLVTTMENLQGPDMRALQASADAFASTSDAFMERFKEAIQSIPQNGVSSAALTSAAHRIEPSRRAADSAADQLSNAWAQLDEDLTRAVTLTRVAQDPGLTAAMLEAVSAVAGSVKLGELDAQIPVLDVQIGQLSVLSRSLRPAAATMRKMLNTVQSMRQSAETWSHNLSA
ncbi:DUF4143 domain-containing protein [Actinomyces radicidentis]|uniref:DUF4143 domain-containing protein n=1 Tax=Actinomyces radicidentis TaxID=111015 RepID=UPI000A0314CC|nr:DUF4143 domain-containing protein [Actinomyces radicidentis]